MATGDPDQQYRPTGLMRNALVADQVCQDPEKAEDGLLTRPMGDEFDWTFDLGRQLGLELDPDGGVHHTLLFLLKEIDSSLYPWPPPRNQEDWLPLCTTATRGLSALQLYATLLAGPGRWLRGNLPEGTVESLPGKLRGVLAKSLAGEIARVVTQWVEWDIRDLRARRDALLKAAKKQKEKEKAAVLERSKVRPRRRPDAQELADRRKDRAADYRPPPPDLRPGA